MQCFALEGGFKPPKIYHLKSNCFHRVPHENCIFGIYLQMGWLIRDGLFYHCGPHFTEYSQEYHKWREIIRNLHHVPHHIAIHIFFGTFFLINILELRFCKQIFLFLLGYPLISAPMLYPLVVWRTVVKWKICMFENGKSSFQFISISYFYRPFLINHRLNFPSITIYMIIILIIVSPIRHHPQVITIKIMGGSPTIPSHGSSENGSQAFPLYLDIIYRHIDGEC